MAIRGYAAPEVEACYQRARELCRELGDTPQLVPVLHGLWTYHIVRAQHADALALGEQVLELGAATDDDGLLVQGNMEVGWSHFFLGELERAREHLERVLALYDDERHSSHAFIYGDNPATSARSALASVLWLLGYVDQSLRHSEENLVTLRSLVQHQHPYSVAFGLSVAAFLRQYRGDAPATRALAEEVLVLQRRTASRSSARWLPSSRAGCSPKRASSRKGLPRCAAGSPPSSPPGPSWPGRTGCG